MSFRVSLPWRSLLAAMLVCAGAHAQIHEDEKPLPGLDQGVLVHFEKDGAHKVSGGQGKTIGTGDFSVVCHMVPADRPLALNVTVPLLVGSDEPPSHDRKAEWRLFLGPNGSLLFEAHPKEKGASATIETPKGVANWNQAHDIVISVHRDARQPLSGIWVDGIELASATFGSMDLRAALPSGDWDTSGWIRTVTVYDRALTRPEILDLMLRTTGAAASQPKPKHPAPPAGGPLFVPQPDETIALLGGTDAAALADSGKLEGMLLTAFPNARLHFRSLAWEGDTVFKQDRPMNFGPLDQQLERINAGSVWLMFGRQECLDRGREGVAEFKEAFARLLETVAKVTPNLVVVGPPPFQKKPAPMPDLSLRNEDLKAYSSALEEVAKSHGAIFLSSDDGGWKPLPHDNDFLTQFTSDGVTLTNNGCCVLGIGIAKSLGVFNHSEVSLDADTGPPFWAALRAKNRLWHDYWRPSNWAFLYGDRTNQPSSRDPVNPQIRQFPTEQEKYLPLIKEAEEKVYRAVADAQKRLP